MCPNAIDTLFLRCLRSTRIDDKTQESKQRIRYTEAVKIIILFSAFAISSTLCAHALTALRNTPLEKFVKRLGSIAIADGRSVEGLTPVQVGIYFNLDSNNF